LSIALYPTESTTAMVKQKPRLTFSAAIKPKETYEALPQSVSSIYQEIDEYKDYFLKKSSGSCRNCSQSS
jgi:hypothetical protein